MSIQKENKNADNTANRRKTIKRPLNAFSSGRSMIEMLGVLAIIGVLSVAGISGFSNVMDKYKINRTIEQINVISSKLSAIGSEGSSYIGLDNISAIKFQAVPDNMIVDKSNGILRNSYNGMVLISSTTLEKNANDAQAFVILFDNLPKKACLALAANNWGSGEQTSLLGIRVSANSNYVGEDKINMYQGCTGGSKTGVVTACNGGSEISVPMPLTKAIQGCTCTTNTCIFEISYY